MARWVLSCQWSWGCSQQPIWYFPVLLWSAEIRKRMELGSIRNLSLLPNFSRKNCHILLGQKEGSEGKTRKVTSWGLCSSLAKNSQRLAFLPEIGILGAHPAFPTLRGFDLATPHQLFPLPSLAVITHILGTNMFQFWRYSIYLSLKWPLQS